MKHPRSRVFRYSRTCACAGCQCLSVLLLFLLALQTIVVASAFLQKDIQVPEPLLKFAMKKAFSEEVDASWSKIYFDIQGGVFAEKFVLKNSETQEIILNCDSIYLDFDWLLHLFGSPILSTLRLSEGNIYFSSQQSPSGTNEPSLEGLNLWIVSNFDSIEIEQFRASLSGLEVLLSKPVIWNQAKAHPQKQSTFSEDIRNLNQILRNLTPRIPQTMGTISIGSLNNSNEELQLELRFSFPEWDYSSYTLKDIYGSTALGINLIRKTFYLDSLSFNAQCENFITPTLLAAISPVLPQENLTLNVSLFAQRFTFPSPKLPDFFAVLNQQKSENPFFATVEPDPNSPFGLRIFLNMMDNDIIITAPKNHLDNSPIPSWFTKAHFDLHLNNSFFSILSPHLEQIPSSLQIRDFQRMSAIGDIAFEKDFSNFELTSRLQITDLAFPSTTVAYADSSFNFQTRAKTLSFRDLHFTANEKEFGSGSLWFDLEYSTFELDLSGALFPETLSPFLKEWWHKIIKDFSHPEMPPKASVYLSGPLQDVHRLSLFMDMEVEEVAYRGFQLSNLKFALDSHFPLVRISKLAGELPDEENVYGDLAWYLDVARGNTPPVYIDLQGNLAWGKLCDLIKFNPIPNSEIAGKPYLSAKGWIVHEENKTNPKTSSAANLIFSFQNHSGLSRINGLEIKSLEFDGNVDEADVDISFLSGQFNRGILSGTLLIDQFQIPNERTLYLSLDLWDSDIQPSVEQLSALLPKKIEDKQKLHSSEVNGGKMSASISLRYPFSSPADSSGEGLVQISNAPIGTFNVFGGLSQILKSIGISFSSLDMKNLNFSWNLSERLITIPDFLLTGPSLQLTAFGTINIPETNLNFEMQGLAIKNLFGFIVSPISSNIGLSLRGTIANPDWQFKVQPFRWVMTEKSGS